MTATVKYGQSIWDVAIQHNGSANAAFGIARLNNISLTGDIPAGTILKLPEVIDQSVVKYFKDNKIEPATAVKSSECIPDPIIIHLRRSTDNADRRFRLTEMKNGTAEIWSSGGVSYVWGLFDLSGNMNHAYQDNTALQPIFDFSEFCIKTTISSSGLSFNFINTDVISHLKYSNLCKSYSTSKAYGFGVGAYALPTISYGIGLFIDSNGYTIGGGYTSGSGNRIQITIPSVKEFCNRIVEVNGLTVSCHVSNHSATESFQQEINWFSVPKLCYILYKFSSYGSTATKFCELVINNKIIYKSAKFER